MAGGGLAGVERKPEGCYLRSGPAFMYETNLSKFRHYYDRSVPVFGVAFFVLMPPPPGPGDNPDGGRF